MTNQNEDIHRVADSISQQLLQERLQILESSFRRLGVSDPNACQPPLLDHRQCNQIPLNVPDPSMNVRDYNPSYYQHPTEREEVNQAMQRLWFNHLNGYDVNESYNYGYHGRTNTGLIGRPPYIGSNRDIGQVPFLPSNHNLRYQSPSSSYSHCYAPGTRTNHHGPYSMNNSRAKDTTLSRAKDRVESPELQKMIVQGSMETINKIFDELISHVCELMIDPFGHQVFHKLLERCTNEQITRVLDIVIQQPFEFVTICGDSHGTRAVQALMRSLCYEEQIYRFMVTIRYVALLLTKSTNGNHVIMFCFGYISPLQTNCLLQVIVQNCYQVAIDQHGCCMLQQCIGKSPREIRDPLISEIITNALSLCMNCYGNYVIQYVLELEDCQVAAALSRYLEGNYVQLSCDKYGSHVVQKCLKSRHFNSRMIINELLSDIDSLVVNPFGNYVIQTAWDVSQHDMRMKLHYHINKSHSLMSCNTFGKKVLKKLNLWT